MIPFWIWSISRFYRSRAAIGYAQTPKNQIFPLIFSTHWPAACAYNGKSGYGLLGFASKIRHSVVLQLVSYQGEICRNPGRAFLQAFRAFFLKANISERITQTLLYKHEITRTCSSTG